MVSSTNDEVETTPNNKLQVFTDAPADSIDGLDGLTPVSPPKP